MIKTPLRLLCLMALVSSLSCQKLPDLSNDDGTPASPDAVTTAMIEAWGDQSQQELQESLEGAKIKKNEKVWFSKTAQLYAQPPREFEAQLFQVDEISLGQTTIDGEVINYRQVDITVAKQSIGENGGQSPVITQHDYKFAIAPKAAATAESIVANVLQPLAGSQLRAQSSPEALSIDYFIGYALACNARPEYKWKPYCYNLRSWKSVEAAPMFTREKPNCRDLPNCQINVSNIAYDLVSEVIDEDTGSTARQKTKIHLKFSKDLPFLSRLVSACFQGMGKYNNQPYVATVCTEVSDFERGDTAP